MSLDVFSVLRVRRVRTAPEVRAACYVLVLPQRPAVSYSPELPRSSSFAWSFCHKEQGLLLRRPAKIIVTYLGLLLQIITTSTLICCELLKTVLWRHRQTAVLHKTRRSSSDYQGCDNGRLQDQGQHHQCHHINCGDGRLGQVDRGNRYCGRVGPYKNIGCAVPDKNNGKKGTKR